ncbi:hypothetical protein GCM10011506_10310 [Marivirga lumbricoides]|uniref:histidine kinase n=1 Tax=Marivirga lumbricoides TaxID=1046115 RepID=A0ABQ1LR39_9BACT|nr:hypothetical protein GCM10011506_10310 [Marivirga lumbricoides]
MGKQLRIILLIIAVIIVPVLFYGYLQLLSLSDDEQMAEKIYQKQMETVLFSLNQYADDVMSGWARQLGARESSLYENAEELILSNESIQLLAITNINSKKDTLFYSDYINKSQHNSEKMRKWLAKNDSLLNKLSSYMKAGFQKIQPVEWIDEDSLGNNQVGVTFMLFDQDSATLYNALILLEERYWTEGVLGGKMQKIATDNFGLAVLQFNNEAPPQVIYSTGNFNLAKGYVKNNLWILPNMKIAIQSSGENYIDLVRQRSRKNLTFLIITVLIIVIGVIVIIKNIREALRIAELKSDFVANVSHEIRTPLSLIRMYSETLLLGRAPTDEKKKHYYNVIFQESGRLTYLVNNILDFSRIEANRKTYQMGKISLNEVVKDVYEQYSHSFEEKQVQNQLKLNEKEIYISADKQALEEAISNLIDNAIKYNESSIQVIISTYSDTKYAYCEVKDNGIGIPDGEESKIFDKFYRVERSLTQKTKGTGLGLSLVKHIMEAHRGEVRLKNKFGKGCSFILKFPLEVKNDQNINS